MNPAANSRMAAHAEGQTRRLGSYRKGVVGVGGRGSYISVFEGYFVRG